MARSDLSAAEAGNVRGALTGDGDRTRCLVVVFLRGAADGLHLVPPIADDAYYRARPLLAVAPRVTIT